MGIFNFFKRKDSDYENKEKEMINIINDNNEYVAVEKQKWLDEYFYPIINNENIESKYKCDVIEIALSVGIKEQIIEPILQIYANNPNSMNVVTLLFKVYCDNEMYDDAVSLYDKYEQDNGNLNWYMYYEKATAYEKLNQLKEQEKALLLSFQGNNNHIETIDKFIELMKKIDPNNLDEWMDNLCKNSRSWYLYKKLAILYATKGNKTEACECVLKCMEYSPYNEKLLIELGEILKSINKLDEYYNYIISQYDVNVASDDMTNRILDFYLIDNKPEKGLELLKELYYNNKDNEYFYKFEKRFLDKISNYKLSTKLRASSLQGPLYKRIMGQSIETREGQSLLLLHFILDPTIEKPSEKIENFCKNIAIYLNDELFLNTNLNVKNMLLYNSYGPVLYQTEYQTEYLESIAKSSNNLDNIMYGVISEVDKEDNFYLNIYLYKTKENIKIELFNTEVRNEIQPSIKKFLTSILERNLSVNVNGINISDNEFVTYLASYNDIILNEGRPQEHRLFEIKRLMKYLLDKPNSYKMNMCLSLLKILSKKIPDIKERYKEEINEKIKYIIFDEEIRNNLNIVYGGKDD